MKVGIIGGGRVGSCLASYFKECGWLVGITAAKPEHSRLLAEQLGLEPLASNKELVAKAEVIFLTVPDRLIGTVAEELAQEASLTGKLVLHCSGSLGLEPLSAAAEHGAHIGSMHPLQSFAGGKTELKGVYMAIDGEAGVQRLIEQLVRALGGHAFHVPAAERAAYHAAACICSNYAVALEAIAQEIMSRWMPNGNKVAAWQALLPLFNGTAANLRQATNPGTMLTGPIARGDVGTVAKHLAVLPQKLLPSYCALGMATARLALENQTIDVKIYQQLQELLQKTEV